MYCSIVEYGQMDVGMVVRWWSMSAEVPPRSWSWHLQSSTNLRSTEHDMSE